jgi:hypothetical protein
MGSRQLRIARVYLFEYLETDVFERCRLSQGIINQVILESWETQFAGVKNQSLAASVFERIFERLRAA